MVSVLPYERAARPRSENKPRLMAYLKDHEAAQEFGFFNPKQPQACCSLNPDEQQACAVYANKAHKANPKVGLVLGYFPPLLAFLRSWMVWVVSAMQSSVPSLVPFA